ncbi:MAG: NAD-dependent epimerase/dehydratase family protein [Hyphomicrobiaceae bacterium]|nr:NAD-dependent epimerase/dehydratase family protein [Hyphomicrobiaceae bacterium]
MNAESAGVAASQPIDPPRLRVLVTGATGFIGQRLVPYLAGRGYLVRAAARQPDSVPAGPGIQPALLPDLDGQTDWAPLVQDMDAVVHLAGLAHATTAIPEERYMAANHDAVIALMAALAASSSARRLVFMSSARAVSGPSCDFVLSSDRPSQATDAYGRSKFFAEMMLRMGHTGSYDYTILRPVLVYGPGVKANMARLIDLARLPLPLPLGGLTGRRSLLALDNLCQAIEFVLSRPEAGGRIFFVADGPPLTVPEIIVALRAGLDRRPGLVPLPWPLISRLARSTGFGPALERLTGNLVVDTSALDAIGFRPRLTTHAALAALASAQARVRP